jgi:transposase
MLAAAGAHTAAVRFARFGSSATRVPHAERDDLYAVVRDQQAVTAGLALPCRSAAMEGNINMITMIKRQMYGRAAFPSCASA